MNKQRRKEIEALAVRLDDLKAEIVYLAGEEEETADALPENLRYSERADAMRDAAMELEDIAGEAEGLADRLREVAG